MAVLLKLADNVVTALPDIILEYVKSYVLPNREVTFYERCSSHFDPFEVYKEEFDLFLEGSTLGLNSRKIKGIDPKPVWLDTEKALKGQEFGRKYYASICYSNLISLYLLFAHERSLRPLIYTRRSGDIESAYRRYASTINRVKSWYFDDLMDDRGTAKQHIKVVNNYHLSISSTLNAMDEKEFIRQSQLDEEAMETKHCFESVCGVVKKNNVSYDDDLLSELDSSVHLSQSHMAVTQFGFMGLIVLFPDKFGIKNISDDDIECFTHLWMYIGYLLGIENKYNICNGPIGRVRTRCKAVLECILKPCLLKINESWEHMSICACQGINTIFRTFTFETTLAYLLYCIDLKYDLYYDRLVFYYKIRHNLNKIIFMYLIPISFMREKANNFVTLLLDKQQIYS